MAPEMKRIGEVCWEIPKTYKPGMRVPARIYATEPLLKTMDDGVYEQVTNMATLPGIVKASMAMPDAHWGYGFCVGGVAAFDAKEGVISPGGIGYDINCLTGNTRVLTDSGWKKLSEFEQDFLEASVDQQQTKIDSLVTLNRKNQLLELQAPVAFMRRPAAEILKVRTSLGLALKATEEHPFLTPTGMKEVGKLKAGDKVSVVPEDSVVKSKVVFDEIEEIKKIPYSGYVYDFTVPKTHNFVANGFIVNNCGMRLATTNLAWKDVKPKLRSLVDLLFETVPTGVGCEGSIKLSQSQFDEVMTEGVDWCARNGYAWKEDVERIEEHGKLSAADPSKVSQRARSRGIKQLGTLGSGNHYLEIQVAGEKDVFDAETAKAWGITEPDQVVVMFHCGSRGFGHQICSDYVDLFLRKLNDYKISLPDRELACAPFQSKEGQDYFGAMCAAINFSFASRQVILHRVREAFAKVFKTDAEKLGMNMVYDVAHNTAKIEEYKVEGKKRKLVVHRKGATRCFGPSRPELEKVFRKTGQPVIVGGSMETGSYLCVGMDGSDDETFASTMHGSGRTMSRAQAKREIRGDALQRDMEKRGIYVRSASMSGLAEEAGVAYKDIHQVVETMDIAGISKRVVALRPVGNIKG